MKNISIFEEVERPILGSLNQSDIAKWKKEKDLLQLAMLNRRLVIKVVFLLMKA